MQCHRKIFKNGEKFEKPEKFEVVKYFEKIERC